MKCISCKKEIEMLDLGTKYLKGAEGIIVAWYGSRHDQDSFKLSICDDCLDTDIVENMGNLGLGDLIN